MFRFHLIPLTALVALCPSCGSGERESALDQGSALGVYASFPMRRANGFPEFDPLATVLPPPPFQGEEIFPCVECHDPDFMESDPEVRALGDPHDVMPVFAHAEYRLWCFDCHDNEDRDLLKLASGETIPFEEAPRLCGQCHGEQHRDWVGGVHGLRTGAWNGAKDVHTCASCHDAHAPLSKPIEPMAGPLRPERNR